MVAVSELDGRSYQARFDALAGAGQDVHGEASLVRTYLPQSVLDAGCGTGRVAIELARYGIATLGVDVSASMIAEARRRAPTLDWIQADLATLDLDRRFDVVVMAGNVPLFCPVEDRPLLVRAAATHVAPGGRLIAGFELDRGFTIAAYDDACGTGGLQLEERWSTWDGHPMVVDDTYAVSVHHR
jgi:SAM-dependent methyltransferase